MKILFNLRPMSNLDVWYNLLEIMEKKSCKPVQTYTPVANTNQVVTKDILKKYFPNIVERYNKFISRKAN